VTNVWCELKYGDYEKGAGISICELDNPYLIRVFRNCALSRAQRWAEQSNGVDKVIHAHDLKELERLQEVFSLLMPDQDDDCT